MKLKLIDSHAHIQFAIFKDDAESVIRRALDAGIWMVNVGTQRDTSVKAIELAEKFREGVYAAVGLHPIHTDKSFHDEQELGGDVGFISRGEEFDYEYYKKLAQHPKVVAIGECGLDYYRSLGSQKSPPKADPPLAEKIKKQKKAFIQQIKLAHELKKPLMIHCREAYEDLIKILNSYFIIPNSTNPGIIHFFSGTKDQAQKLLDMGFYFSFGGVITFTRDYDEIVKYIPLDRILLETDAPYVAPAPYRGKRNEPLYIIEVAQKMAELKGASVDKISQQTVQNAKAIHFFAS